jgi:hypothetical protein
VAVEDAMARPFRTRVVAAGAAAVLVLASAATVRAQAWLPPKGEASFSIGYAYSFADEHFDYQGRSNGPGDMIWHNIVSDLSYGITDRLAARVNLPFVTSRYGGTNRHPRIAGREYLDDGGWHATFQDFVIETRFRATTGALAVTPSVAVQLPSTHYEAYGHTAAGRGLVEGQFAVAAGRLLDPILPSAYAQVRYMYGVPEKVQGISHNRSHLSFELGYLLGSAFTVRGGGIWQKTHGGWRVPIDWPARTSRAFEAHDQLARADYLRMGGSIAYSLTGSIDVNLSGYATVSGKNDVNMKGLGFSITYSASPAQLIKKSRKRKDIT